MDLENAESVISDLEENAKKISSVSKSIEDFKKTIQELEKLPLTIENKGSDYLKLIKESHTNLSKDLNLILKDLRNLEKNLPESIDKAVKKLSEVSLVINDMPSKIKDLEASNSNNINQLEKKIERELDLMKDSSQNEIKNLNINIDDNNKKLLENTNRSIIISLVVGCLVAYLIYKMNQS